MFGVIMFSGRHFSYVSAGVMIQSVQTCTYDVLHISGEGVKYMICLLQGLMTVLVV